VAALAVVAVVGTAGISSAATANRTLPSTRSTSLAQMERAKAGLEMNRMFASMRRPLTQTQQSALRKQLTVVGVKAALLAGVARAQALAAKHSIHLDEASVAQFKSVVASPAFSRHLALYLATIDRSRSSATYANYLQTLYLAINPFNILAGAVTALAGLGAGLCIAIPECEAEDTALAILTAGGTAVTGELAVAGEKYNQEQGVTPGGSGNCASEGRIIGEVAGPEIEYTGDWACQFPVQNAQIVVTLYISSGTQTGQYDAVALSCNNCTGQGISPNQYVYATTPACYQAETDVSGTDGFGRPFTLATTYSALKCYKH
jgi:hypothetical protein